MRSQDSAKKEIACGVTSQNLIELWAVSTRPVENNGLGLNASLADRVVARGESSVFRCLTPWRLSSHILTFNAGDFARYSGINVLEPAKL
jgi:hypothetical protein